MSPVLSAESANYSPATQAAKIKVTISSVHSSSSCDNRAISWPGHLRAPKRVEPSRVHVSRGTPRESKIQERQEDIFFLIFAFYSLRLFFFISKKSKIAQQTAAFTFRYSCRQHAVTLHKTSI
jgi:hypothetical protein